MNPLAIILPCFNPPAQWEQIVVSSFAQIKRHLGYAPELIIVNDGSSQDITAAIKYIQQYIPDFLFIDNKQNKGKGAALRDGIQKSNAALYIYTDIDFPYTFDSFLKILEQLQDGNDIVAGVKDSTYYAHTPFVRKLISQFLRFCIRTFLKMPVTDTQCGLKGFNNRGKQYFMSTTIDRYLFDLEFIYLASRKKSKIKLTSIEATLRPEIVFRKMNPKILIQEGLNFLKIFFK